MSQTEPQRAGACGVGTQKHPLTGQTAHEGGVRRGRVVNPSTKTTTATPFPWRSRKILAFSSCRNGEGEGSRTRRRVLWGFRWLQPRGIVQCPGPFAGAEGLSFIPGASILRIGPFSTSRFTSPSQASQTETTYVKELVLSRAGAWGHVPTSEVKEEHCL